MDKTDTKLREDQIRQYIYKFEVQLCWPAYLSQIF
jgi:hypothetical protein